MSLPGCLWMCLFLLSLIQPGTDAAERLPNSLDFRYQERNDLIKEHNHFSNSKYAGYTSIFQDEGIAYIGAKNMLLVLNVSTMDVITEKKWADDNSQEICKLRNGGESCNNYIRTIFKQGENLLICGTMNTYPQVAVFKAKEIDIVDLDKISGENSDVCGTNIDYPMANQVMKFDPKNFDPDKFEIFTGITGYHDNEMAHISWISRLEFKMNPLRLDREKTTRTKHTSSGSWLKDSEFISSFEYFNYIYFIYREKAKKEKACDTGLKVNDAYTIKIARVCSGDKTNGIFQSYSHMQLLCVYNSDPLTRHHINYATKSWLSRTTNTLYIIANNEKNAIQGVCSFNFTAVNDKFNTNLFTRWSQGDSFDKLEYGIRKKTYNARICSNERFSEVTPETKGDQELYNMRGVLGAMHLTAGKGKTFTNIYVDSVRTVEGKIDDVLFITEKDGAVYRYAVSRIVKTHSPTYCDLGGWQIANEFDGVYDIVPDKYSHDKIFILTEDTIWKLDTSKCEIYNKKSSCVNTPDPYCVWDDMKGCHSDTETTRVFLNSGLKNKKPFSAKWNEKKPKCKILKTKVDGGWSNSLHEVSCILPFFGNNLNCSCSNRTCTNPTPMNGGKPCIGDAMVVTCLVPSRWSQWSSWSECSQTCQTQSLTSKRFQSRVCSIGTTGSPCSGQSHNVQICSQLPSCPQDNKAFVGDLQTWGSWTPCSSQCSSETGVQTRFRECKRRHISHRNVRCIGDTKQMRACSSTNTCTQESKSSIQDVWHKKQAFRDGSYSKTAYKSICRLLNNKMVPSLQKIDVNCTSDDECGKATYTNINLLYMSRLDNNDMHDAVDPADLHYAAWSKWSECSCTSIMWRKRKCITKSCDVHSQPREVGKCKPKSTCKFPGTENDSRLRYMRTKTVKDTNYMSLFLAIILSFIAGGVISISVFSYCKRDKRTSTERYFSGDRKEKPRCQPNHYSVGGLQGDPRKSIRRENAEIEENEYTKPPVRNSNESITVEQATLKRDNLLRHSSSGRNASPAALLLKGHKNWRDEEI